MKKILAIVLFSATLTAHAEGFFIGGSLGMASYPDYTGEVTNGLYVGGALSASTTQGLVGGTLDIRGGQWITDNFGWEASLASLGSVNGSFASSGFGFTYTGDYKYTTSAFHVVALGGIPFGRSKLYGKAGLYSASSKFDWNDSYNGIPFSYSSTTSSTGLLIGGGYEFSFNDHFSLRAGLNLYNGVKFENAWTSNIESKSMMQIAVGANYTF